MRIYTRTGDNGETSLFSGERVKKTHPLLAAYGTVDECNSLVGAALAAGAQKEVVELGQQLQRKLFYLGGDFATSMGSAREIQRIRREDVEGLEREMDRLQEILPPLRAFILPGGTAAAGLLHVARAVARRAEREAIEASEEIAINPQALIFLNRISDYLFLLARYENWLAGIEEIEWRVEKKSE